MAEFKQVVAARSRGAVERRASRARADLGLLPTDRVNMAKLIDLELPNLIEGFEMRVEDDHVLGAAEAVTDLNKPIIAFSNRTYESLCRDHGRARMTAAHELGHLLMHCRQPVGLAFMKRYDPRVDPEVQADTFAAAFLMPEVAFRKMRSIREVMKTFGVTRDAATCRARKLRMYWLVNGDRPPAPKRKGRKHMARTP